MQCETLGVQHLIAVYLFVSKRAAGYSHGRHIDHSLLDYWGRAHMCQKCLVGCHVAIIEIYLYFCWVCKLWLVHQNRISKIISGFLSNVV